MEICESTESYADNYESSFERIGQLIGRSVSLGDGKAIESALEILQRESRLSRVEPFMMSCSRATFEIVIEDKDGNRASASVTVERDRDDGKSKTAESDVQAENCDRDHGKGL